MLVLAHDNAPQLGRLAGALAGGRVDVWIHADRSSPLAAAAGALRRHPGVTDVISAHAVAWGGFGMLEATLALLRRARAGGYATYSLVSGSDYPLLAPAALARRLDAVAEPRLRFYVIDGPAWHHRYERRFFNDAWPPARRVLNALSRRLHAARSLRGVVPLRALPDGLVAAFGSQWWTLPATAADAVLATAAERPDVMRFMRHVDIPDELFVHAVLCGQGLADPATPVDDLRYIDWSGGGRHPKTLGLDDLPAVLASGAAFARKVDARRSPGLLDALDAASCPART